MKKIHLTQGQYALIDDEDYERVNAFKWYAHYSNRTKSFYATRKTRRPRQVHVYMHRFIMHTPDELLCDHENGNTLDNRKSNLRNCTNSDNQSNRGPQINNELGLKNICYDRKKGLYCVAINKGGRRVFRKRFSKLQDAIDARDIALKEYHGQFANTNKTSA